MISEQKSFRKVLEPIISVVEHKALLVSVLESAEGGK